MRIDEKFNKRSANLVEVQPPQLRVGSGLALGIKLEFFPVPEKNDQRTLSMHLTKDEALQLAETLIKAARIS